MSHQPSFVLFRSLHYSTSRQQNRQKTTWISHRMLRSPYRGSSFITTSFAIYGIHHGEALHNKKEKMAMETTKKSVVEEGLDPEEAEEVIGAGAGVGAD